MFLSGKVQGVGMRYSVCEIAKKYCVVGTVENLDDGRVKVVIESDRETAVRFESAVKAISTGNIQRLVRFESEPSHEFDRFAIRQ